MNKTTYRIINFVILGMFLMTFFFNTFPYLLPKENILTGTATLGNRLVFTSGLTELKNDSPFNFLIMNSIFVLFAGANFLFYKMNKD